MNKLLCFILLLLIVSTGCYSQTLHTLIFANTHDETVGSSAAKNVEHIRALSAQAATRSGLTVKEYVFDGDQYTFQNLETIITTLQVGTQDAIFFYLNSHGFKSNSDSNFPRVVIESPGSDRYLYSSAKINEALKARCNGCRLNLTVIQACNRVTRISGDLEIEAATSLLDNSKENFTKLFQSRQNVMVTSSRRGKTSIALVNRGSVFTMAFVKALIETSISEEPANISWKKVLDRSKIITLSKKNHRKRYPVWRIEPL